VSVNLDIEFYRRTYSDLSGMSDAELVAHYVNHGKLEGRQARANEVTGAREHFLGQIPQLIDILEIGPFDKPIVRGDRVRYFDVLDQDALIERGNKIGFDTKNTPKIDFVSPQGDLSIVNQKFDAVISSHCIEHQPNFVKHLQHVQRILTKVGKYYLIIPDKRYCFDHFLNESSVTDIICAFLEDRKVHSLKSVVEHRAFITHNDAIRHWSGDHGELTNVRSKAEAATKEWQESDGRYIDVHAWQFTPQSFKEVILSLEQFGWINMVPTQILEPVWGRFEFCATLEFH
jgi:SAM-dependent methyltransferase